MLYLFNQPDKMISITVPSDCGNAPKKEFIKDFNVAYASGKVDFILDNVSDNIEWTIVGDIKLMGKENVELKLNEMANFKASELIIETILTHGKEAAATGVLNMENGKSYAFSDFYTFSSAKGNKVKSMVSFTIEIKR